MRPSMRLPLREANFICSSCRIGATPRISPIGQVRRYASDSSPGILERTRRKIWGTDTPPGLADPYSGSQIMPGSEVSPEKPEAEEPFSLQEGQAPPGELEESLTWVGMPKIGYLPEKEWRLQGSKGKADKVTPWYHNPQPVGYMKAAHQAAVEIGLMQMLGGKVTVVSQTSYSRAIQDQLKSVKIEGQSGNWGDRLRFTSIKTMEALLRVAAGDLTGEAEIAFQRKLKKIAGNAENRLYNRESKAQMQNSLSTLPLADGNLKFVFFARLSKLMSQHIPDYIVSSSTTTGEVFRAQEVLRKKTLRLTPVLLHEIMDKNGASELSNVKILDVRQTRHDNDEDLGRKKAIVSTLYKNGLITKSLGQKHQPPWKQAKKTELNA
ncbi:hypothetical protein PENVUL_c014G06956 [Penicillium vulpinum]|uniref:Large ribosomal subunit protein mL50 n=1 Tax=Penicillium vulpinum TaxID=29845 RepID=A0A1V6S0A1_9EURO|nr:hypothetical protein PENVUL_c014G06956 [Penicillium vulpinum]